MFEPFTLSTSSAPAATAVRISSGSKVSILTRIPAAISSRVTSPSAGKERPGVHPRSITSAPEARKYSAAPRRALRVSRGASLISATISMSHAPYSRAAAARPKCCGISRRSLGPFSTRTPNFSPMTCGLPSQSPGITTRSMPCGSSSRTCAIHGVVISAATVILSTVTSYAKGGAISASTRRSAGSASRPVMKRTRPSEVSPAASSVMSAGRRSGRICSGSL